MAHPPPNPEMNGHEYMILSRLLDQTEKTLLHVDRIERRLIVGDERFSKLEMRVDGLEAGRGFRKIGNIGSWLKQIFTPREWVVGAFLLIMGLKGVLDPAEMKAIILKLIGIAPIPLG